LPDAPGPRSGTSIAYGRGKLWRFGGFDGTRELGELDYLDLEQPRNAVDEKEAWQAISLKDSTDDASSQAIPPARSLAAALCNYWSK